MKKSRLKKILVMMTLFIVLSVILIGCSQPDSGKTNSASGEFGGSSSTQLNDTEAEVPSELDVRFGDNGQAFTLYLEENDTAKAIARHVGTTAWRLSINHYNDYENWEIMQYYDIPNRYDIPDDAETIYSEKAGEVYYFEPNRIVLFYGDAEVTGEYTRIGRFDASDEFREAVMNNPIIEGFGNKIVHIGR